MGLPPAPVDAQKQGGTMKKGHKQRESQHQHKQGQMSDLQLGNKQNTAIYNPGAQQVQI